MRTGFSKIVFGKIAMRISDWEKCLLRKFVYSNVRWEKQFKILIKMYLFSGIKKYIVGLIIKTSSDPETMEREKVYLNKLNMILIQVRLPYFILKIFNMKT